DDARETVSHGWFVAELKIRHPPEPTRPGRLSQNTNARGGKHRIGDRARSAPIPVRRLRQTRRRSGRRRAFSTTRVGDWHKELGPPGRGTSGAATEPRPDPANETVQTLGVLKLGDLLVLGFVHRVIGWSLIRSLLGDRLPHPAVRLGLGRWIRLD